MKHANTAPFWLLLASITATAGASDAVPVIIGGSAELDACGSVGEVRGLNPRGDGFLAVRTGPGSGYPESDRLNEGQQLFLCGSQGEWMAVVYARGEEMCGVSSPIAKRKPYAGPCRSGWAHR